MKRHDNGRRAGWMFTDALIAMAIIALAAGLLGAMLIRVSHTCRTIGQHRVALRMANEALLLAQTDPAAATATPAAKVTIEDIVATPAPAGWRWVQVTAIHREGRAQLTGLIRSKP